MECFECRPCDLHSRHQHRRGCQHLGRRSVIGGDCDAGGRARDCTCGRAEPRRVRHVRHAGHDDDSFHDSGSTTTVAPHTPYDATLPPVGAGTVHKYIIRLKDETFEIAPGVRFQGWTFDGTAPGPVIHVRQGDMVDVTLVNGGAIPHSIDFHAALTAPNVSFASVPAGGSLHFRFRAETPGAFMYHCGTPPVLAHIANGMYGAIIVDPKEGLPPVAKSVVLVSGEWYLQGDGVRRRPRSISIRRG